MFDEKHLYDIEIQWKKVIFLIMVPTYVSQVILDILM